jgi:hypothetical protein
MPLRRLLPLCGLLFASTANAAALPPAVARASLHAMEQCQEYMHEDADEYVACMNAVAAAIPRKRANTSAALLGHYYYAWVGANNSARMSLPGAEEAARIYLKAFRPLQRKLKLDDQTLCAAVPGDCAARVARIVQMEAESRAMPPRR